MSGTPKSPENAARVFPAWLLTVGISMLALAVYTVARSLQTHGERRQCDASYAGIARSIRVKDKRPVSARAVNRAVKELIDVGAAVRTKRKNGQTCILTTCWEPGVPEKAPSGLSVVSGADGGKPPSDLSMPATADEKKHRQIWRSTTGRFVRVNRVVSSRAVVGSTLQSAQLAEAADSPTSVTPTASSNEDPDHHQPEKPKRSRYPWTADQAREHAIGGGS